jgi:hypothetical protein
VTEHLGELEIPKSPKPVDSSGRDEGGRFLPSYNERYRKSSDDPIGPGFASVER